MMSSQTKVTLAHSPVASMDLMVNNILMIVGPWNLIFCIQETSILMTHTSSTLHKA